MQRILLSALVVGGVVGAAVYGTTAFFSDTETSVDNTFQAGALDLTIDSTAHYNGMVCALIGESYLWQDEGNQSIDPLNSEDAVIPEMLGTACAGTWTAQDLTEKPFFSYDDIKPGDIGENTISMHVSNNDAWLRMRLVGQENADNLINDPESEAVLAENGQDGPWCGELAENMQYSMWVDHGTTPAWDNDEGEGDNIMNFGEVAFDSGVVLSDVVAQGLCDTPPGAPVPTNWTTPVEISANETQYIGVAWNVPDSVGNEIQTDSIMFDVEFQVEQRRNNDTPFIQNAAVINFVQFEKNVICPARQVTLTQSRSHY